MCILRLARLSSSSSSSSSSEPLGEASFAPVVLCPRDKQFIHPINNTTCLCRASVLFYQFKSYNVINDYIVVFIIFSFVSIHKVLRTAFYNHQLCDNRSVDMVPNIVYDK